MPPAFLDSSHSVSTAGCLFPWIPDQGDGTFRNPIIYADYSDPDVVRHGDDFYLVASSFNHTPGLPILHSKDLANWTLINHAVKNLPHPRYAEVQPGCGVWAPAIRFHAGKFWIFFPMPDEGIYVTTADHPAGKWSEPHLLQEGKGLIDPCPLWDDDGRTYLVHAYARSRSGIQHILRVRPMAPDGSRLLGEGEIIFHDPDRHPIAEGPKFLKRNGWYYIFAPAGGVENGWQLALRSRKIFGPYEARIVLEQGATNINGPHQGALVDTVGGDWWFVHFQDVGIPGRIVHLQPVNWQDDWPVMGLDQDGNGIGEPVLRHSKPRIAEKTRITIPQTSDEFDSATLGLQWQWQANHRDDWFELDARKKRLRLFPQFSQKRNFTQLPNLLLQKFPARSFAVETWVRGDSLEAGQEGGLVVIGESCAALALKSTTTGHQIIFQINGGTFLTQKISAAAVLMRVTVKEDGSCHFSFAVADQNFQTVLPPFVVNKGKWVGAKVGLYSAKDSQDTAKGFVEFDYFHFSPPA